VSCVVCCEWGSLCVVCLMLICCVLFVDLLKLTIRETAAGTPTIDGIIEVVPLV